ncbi:MAG: cyclophane-forming radical SAM/SPASM peptide maturase GrrM/OscB [Crocosphaera sp.]|nr:cyclophane-forming radical SAM/SPASM peptide maturase GrrM/OscB [Crocosphaera sp.]
MVQLNSAQKQLNLLKFGPVRLVVLQAGSFCNLDCDYCYLPDRKTKHRLSVDLIFPIFENLLSSSLVRDSFTVCWHLGEPLAVPMDFYGEAIQIIAQIKARLRKEIRINYSVQTNGLFLTQAWCDFFQEHRFNVGVSIDGPAFIHDVHRKTPTGLGTHAATMRSIKLLQNNQLDLYVIAVLTETSLDYPDEIFQFFRDNGIKRIGFNIEEIEGVNRTSSLQQDNISARIRAFWERFWELTASVKGEMQVREFEDVSELILKSSGRLINQMSHPFAIISIDYQGNFSTYSPELLTMKSDDYEDFVLGNLVDEPLESACDHPKFWKLFEDISGGCRLCEDHCPYFSLCGGGAPSNKYWENDTFVCSETMACRYNKQLVVDVALDGIERQLGLKN